MFLLYIYTVTAVHEYYGLWLFLICAMLHLKNVVLSTIFGRPTLHDQSFFICNDLF